MCATMTFQLMVNTGQVATQINDLRNRKETGKQQSEACNTGLSLEITKRIFYLGY